MNFAYGEIKDNKKLTIGDFLTNFSNTYCVNQIVSNNISLSQSAVDIKAEYKTVLAAAAKVVKQEKMSNAEKAERINNPYFKWYNVFWQNLQSSVGAGSMFYTIRQELLEAQSENLGIFDNFVTQLELIVSKIKEGFTHILFDQNKEVNVGDTTIIVNFATLAENSNDPLLDLTNQYFETSYSFTSWSDNFDETPYANQYAFYWYKYDGESPASAFMPFGWEIMGINLQEISILLDSTK
jgi:hypothetical protein